MQILCANFVFQFTAVIPVIKRQMYSTLLEVTPVENNYFWLQAIDSKLPEFK